MSEVGNAVIFKSFLYSAMQHQISWDSLVTLVSDICITLEKSREINMILLQELKSCRYQEDNANVDLEQNEAFKTENNYKINDSKNSEYNIVEVKTELVEAEEYEFQPEIEPEFQPETVQRPPADEKVTIENYHQFLNLKVNNVWMGARKMQLWYFVLELLSKQEENGKDIAWLNGGPEFKILNPSYVASLWGAQNNSPKMSVENFKKTLREYYKKNMIVKGDGAHEYKFQFEHMQEAFQSLQHRTHKLVPKLPSDSETVKGDTKKDPVTIDRDEKVTVENYKKYLQKYKGFGQVQLWFFILEMLANPEDYSHFVSWIDGGPEFIMHGVKDAAKLWGLQKNVEKDTSEDNFLRSIRIYYDRGWISKMDAKYTYRFNFEHLKEAFDSLMAKKKEYNGIDMEMVLDPQANTFKCHYEGCDFEALTQASFRKHYDSHTVVKTIFNCEQCEKTFTNAKNLKIHVDGVHRKLKPHHCDICGKSFFQRLGLKKHIRTVHEKIKEFACDECGKCFSQAPGLEMHIQAIHRKNKPFKCDRCGKNFVNMGNLNAHIKDSHETDKETLKVPCEICGKILSNANACRIHIQTVHEKIKKTCDICGKEFATTSAISVHKRAVHQKLKPHQCDQCEKAFSNPQLLKKHKQIIHEGLKPFQCDRCEKSFTQKPYLTTHVKMVHLGINPFECEKCGRVFTQNHVLKAHMQTHH